MSIKENKFDVKFVLLLSLALFSLEIMENFYDNQAPVSLAKYLPSVALIGLVMGLDNILGLFLQPIMGNISDNTRTRIGRRMPFIIIAIPLSAIFFLLIPYETSLLTLMIAVIGYIAINKGFKAPVEALVPDFIPPEHRSKANSLNKVLVSLSIILAALISELLVDVDLKIAFLVPVIITLASLVVVVLTIKEKNSFAYKEILEEEKVSGKKKLAKEDKVNFIAILKAIPKEKDKTTLIVLFAILSYSIAWSGVRSLLTLYGMDILGLSRGSAGALTIYGGIAFAIFAFPLAYYAEKLGRLLFIRLGLIMSIAGMIIGFSIPGLTTTIIAVILIATANAMVQVNFMVIVWGFAPSHKETGSFTGLFYMFWYIASSIGPFLIGLFIDLTAMSFYFLIISVFAIISLILMFFVKREHPDELNE